jgi:hypothetical protein
MEGMMDLSRKNQLPDHERGVCLKLLFRITLLMDIFDEDEEIGIDFLSFYLLYKSVL